MKRDSGFTLIELLLVLAIIGIISAIAIPALMGQRSRARDKASMANADSIIAELVGSYDRFREAHDTVTVANFESSICGTKTSPLIPQYWTTTNPWTPTAPGYLQGGIVTEADSLGTSTKAAATSDNMGQVVIGFLPTSDTVASGNIVTAVYLHTAFLDSTATSTNVYFRIARVD